MYVSTKGPVKGSGGTELVPVGGALAAGLGRGRGHARALRGEAVAHLCLLPLGLMDLHHLRVFGQRQDKALDQRPRPDIDGFRSRVAFVIFPPSLSPSIQAHTGRGPDPLFGLEAFCLSTHSYLFTLSSLA